MNDAQFEEWFNNCNNSIDEVVIVVDNTPQGGNGTGLDFSPWVPINLPPVQGSGNNPGGSGGNIGGGTAWYVPNTVSANSFSITLALGIAPNSDIGNWLAQQTGDNQELLDAIATYLNDNRDSGNTGNTNNPNTNEGTDNPFEWQLPISDDAISTVIALIEFLDGGPGGTFNGELTPEDLEALEECIENSNTATFDACFEELGEDDLDIFISDCNKLNNLSNSQDYNTRLQELKNATTGNTEIGYWGYNQDDTEMIYHQSTRFESQPGANEVFTSLPVFEADSYIHNHFNPGNGTLPVFSGSDLYTAYKLYINGLMDVDKFVMVVVTPGQNTQSTDDDTLYAIIISSESDFADFGSVFLSQPEVVDRIIYGSPEDPINSNISTSLNEERLAKAFKKFNSGMTLYRGNTNDLNSWTRIKVRNNNTINENPCN